MKSFRLDDHPVAFLRPRLSFPYAWAGHIPFACVLVDLLRPHRLVELGTDSGNSYLAFCQAVEYLGIDTQCRAVDSWRGDAQARQYGDDVYQVLRAWHDPHYGRFSRLLRCHFDEAVAEFADGSIDLLHIDGLHTYQAVRHDFDTWLPKLSPQSVVLLHDTQVQDDEFGTGRLLHELAQDYPSFEFTHSNGLGVIQTGADAPAAFLAFLDAAQGEPERMRTCFRLLGGTVVTADGEAPAQVDVVVPNLVCSLFYRDEDASFAEARRRGVRLATGAGAQDIYFELPPGIRPRYVRIDPCEAPGVFRIGALELGIVGTERRVAVMHLAQRLGHVQGDLLPPPRANDVRFVAWDRDPYIEIDVGDCVAGMGASGTLWLRAVVDFETVLPDPREWALVARQAEASREMRRVASDHISIRSLQRSLTEVSQRFSTLSREAAEGHTESRAALEQIRASMSALHDETGGHHATLRAALRQQRAESGHWRRGADASLAELRKQQAVLREELRMLVQQQRKPGLGARLRGSIHRDWIRFGLAPIQHLQLLDVEDQRWQVTDIDPMFACTSERFPLAPGWYEVELNALQHGGRSAQVMFYPDYGPDIAPDLVGRALPPLAPGRSRHVGLLRFDHPVHGLRFDPANAICELSIRSLSLRRVGRGHAAWFLWQHRAVDVDVPGGSTAAADGVRAWWRKVREQGLRPTVAHIYERYATPAPERNTYHAWVREYDNPSRTMLQAARAESERWSLAPTISILLPTYNSNRTWLRCCIDSVLAQSYPQWELCIADDASPQPDVMHLLEEYAARDPRIHVVRRASNGHISASTNSALELATGEYVALLDHDDELHPLALFEVVKALRAHPAWRLLYTDEDKIDMAGERYDPYMKPDWNYDLFLAQNCISHLGVYERHLVGEIGGFRQGFDGSQDWDLALRCVEKLSPGEIGHVPHVLYHWRAVPGSTAVAVDAKGYARDAARKALTEHLQRRGVNARVSTTGDASDYFRVRFALPDPRPRVSIIIPTRDGLSFLKRCVESILDQTTYPDYEIVIVDNQSRVHATQAWLRGLWGEPRAHVIQWDYPFNYSALNNYAVARVEGEVVALVNNDIEVITPDWLDEMVAQAMRPGIGAVGAMLYYPDNTIQHGGVVLGVHGVAAHAWCGMPRGYAGQMGRARLCQTMTAVTAACMVIRKQIYQQVGGMDEGLTVAFNDIDFCLRVRRAGYRNLWTPFAELYHLESATRGYEDTPEKHARFKREVDLMHQRWGDELTSDPCYNPNLTLDGTPFDLAFPPRCMAGGRPS